MPNSGWESLQIVRQKGRPTVRDYLPAVFGEFLELHGDRLYGDDGAVLGGIGSLEGIPVTVIGQVKGRDLKENQACNFAMPRPEGYRKALRLAHQAEKFHRPVVCFIDTPGADATMGAEERGQGEAIARSLFEMSRLTVPVLAVITGEGNSGGALALAVADRVLMLENAVYAILSPEGFSSILWKDPSRRDEACEVMKLTAPDLKELGVIDEIIPEPAGGAHLAPEILFREVDRALSAQLAQLDRLKGSALTAARYQKFRRMGAAAPKEEA